MKTITIITPANIELEYRLAGAGSRMAAAMIDTLLQFLAIILFAVALFGGAHQLENAGISVRYSTVYAIFIVIQFIIYFGYFITCEMMMNGQTIGKRLFGLRTIRDNGQPIEFAQSLMRGIIRATVDTFTGVFVILFSKKHKRIGDMAAGTLVVIENSNNDFALSIRNWTLPEGVPALIDMTAEERSIVEAWLLRKDDLPHGGAEIEVKIVKYFAERKAAADRLNELTA